MNKVTSPSAAPGPRLRRLVRPLAFLGGVLAIGGRAPSLLLEPRFWAEEGSRYFPTAFHKNWIGALLQVQHGYFAFWPNLAATLAARIVPLQTAPFITTLLALVVQLIPMALILWGRSPLWPNLSARLVGAALYLLAPVAGEVWLNTVNSQFYLAVVAALILNEDAAAPLNTRHWLYNGLLVLAGLTGPVACFLTPLFVWRAWAERGRVLWLRAGLLAGCAAIEGGIILLSAQRGELPVLVAGPSLPVMAEVLWTQSVALCLLGYQAATASLNALAGLASQPVLSLLASLALITVEAALFWFLARALAPAARRYLLGAYGIVLLFSLLGSLGVRGEGLAAPGVTGRYFYAPNVLLLLSVGQSVAWNRAQLAQARGWLCLALLAVALAAGLLNYSWPTLAPAGWPKWRDEVALYQQNPRHPLAIWPLGWIMPLAPP